MGSDMAMDSRFAAERRGYEYPALKSKLCKILGLRCEFDRGGPGNYEGVSDTELVQAVKSLLAKTQGLKCGTTGYEQPEKEAIKAVEIPDDPPKEPPRKFVPWRIS